MDKKRKISKNITTLPLEILEKITLWINDIYDLENWLTCAYRLADIQSVQTQRQELTIEKRRERNTRAELLFNTKFAGTNEKRRRLHGVFNNHLLVEQQWKNTFCMSKWFNIDSKETYESFMNEYRTIWVKQDPSKSTTTEQKKKQVNKSTMTTWEKKQKAQKTKKKKKKME